MDRSCSPHCRRIQRLGSAACWRREETDFTVARMQRINYGGCLTVRRQKKRHAQPERHLSQTALKAIKRSSAFIMNSLHHYREINDVTFELQCKRPSSFDYKAFQTLTCKLSRTHTHACSRLKRGCFGLFDVDVDTQKRDLRNLIRSSLSPSGHLREV